jgi:hypothetical protein
MYNFKINDNEYKIPTTWDEITLGKFIEIGKLDQMKDTYIIDDLYYIRLVEILSDIYNNDLDDLEITEFKNILENISFINEVPKWKVVQHIEIGEDLYVVRDLNKLTMGEKISISTLIKDKNEFDVLLYIIAIVVRPGKRVYDNELKKDIYIIDKFDGDMDKINNRISILKGLSCTQLMGISNFFLNGNNI